MALEQKVTAPSPDDDRPGPDAATILRRRKLELARSDCVHQLAVARAEAHREMLRQALESLDDEIAKLGRLAG